MELRLLLGTLLIGSLTLSLSADQFSELMDAVARGDNSLPALQSVIDSVKTNKKEFLNRKNSEGQTALMRAISFTPNPDKKYQLLPLEFKDTIALLLKNGADPNATQIELKGNERLVTRTPLIMAATRGNAVIIKLLLDAKADVNYKNGIGNTALMEAARQGHIAPIYTLLKNGNASIDVQNNQGRTALMMAALAGQVSAVYALLVLSNPDKTIREKRGKTAFELIDMQLQNPPNDDLKKRYKLIRTLLGGSPLTAPEWNSINVNKNDLDTLLLGQPLPPPSLSTSPSLFSSHLFPASTPYS